MGTKRDPFFRNFPQGTKAKYLKSAAIREDRVVPTHKLMKTAGLRHHITSRSEIKVVGVTQNDLHTQLFQFMGRCGLNSSLGPYRHENRGLNHTMGCFKLTKTGS